MAAGYELHEGDCLEVIPNLAPASVAMVFADLPYGITRNAWDSPISLNSLWPLIRRVSVAGASFVFTASMRFAGKLIESNTKRYRYDLVWQKHCPSNGNQAKRRPLNYHEHILVFSGDAPATYNPQMQKRVHKRTSPAITENTYINKNTMQRSKPKAYAYGPMIYPKSVLVGMHEGRHKSIHPTQKPVALLEWIIATYTNPGDTVLDPCFGSGTTGVACARLGRRFIGIERDADYFTAGKARIKAAYAQFAEKPAQSALAI